MILIADSGSTKTAWIYTDGYTQMQFTTGGANPFFRSTEDMVTEWKESPVDKLRGKVTQVYFYAAGVVNNEKADVIRKALHVFFPEAETSVESDLLAAAHATLGNKSGIACILGTGSNSCLYNGKEITAHVPPLGFILGDEGSGAVLGRMLVGDYLKKTMPEELQHQFNQSYPIDYGEFLNRVYRQEKPNMFLAGFVPFLKKNIHHTYCADLTFNAFDLFVTRNVAQYAGYDTQPVCFAGSVAYYFQEQLKAVFLKRNLMLGEIIKEPLHNLLNHHLQHK
jgi:glucosamine kinase